MTSLNTWFNESVHHPPMMQKGQLSHSQLWVRCAAAIQSAESRERADGVYEGSNLRSWCMILAAPSRSFLLELSPCRYNSSLKGPSRPSNSKSAVVARLFHLTRTTSTWIGRDLGGKLEHYGILKLIVRCVLQYLMLGAGRWKLNINKKWSCELSTYTFSPWS